MAIEISNASATSLIQAAAVLIQSFTCCVRPVSRSGAFLLVFRSSGYGLGRDGAVTIFHRSIE